MVIGFRFGARFGDTLVFQFRVMAEVNEEAKLKPGSFQVIENLSAMLVSEVSDCL